MIKFLLPLIMLNSKFWVLSDEEQHILFKMAQLSTYLATLIAKRVRPIFSPKLRAWRYNLIWFLELHIPLLKY